MKNTIDRDGIIVLDEVQLKTVGNRIVGGEFAAAMELTVSCITVFGAVVGACYWLCNPANRREAWEIFMGNFRRTAVAAVATAAEAATQTSSTAVDDLNAVETALGSGRSDSTVFFECLNIVDDPNEE